MGYFGANFGNNFSKRPIVILEPQSTSRRPSPKVTEKIIILPIRAKLISKEKLSIKAKLISKLKLSIIAKMQTLLKLPIKATLSAEESLRVIGTISNSLELKITGTISDIVNLPIHGKIKFTIKKLSKLLGIMDIADTVDEQLETISFEFNEVLGAAGEDERELEFDEPSSFVGKVTYTPELQTLEMVLNGNIYHYCGVPHRIFDAFFGAESKGAFYNREIKGLYLC